MIMKKSTKFIAAALVAVTVLGGSVLTQPTNATAMASSAYKRNKITKVKVSIPRVPKGELTCSKEMPSTWC
ncbi:hypothetical protein LXEBMM8_EKPBGFGD_01933 [Lactiplantibacillus xiangfangensis]